MSSSARSTAMRIPNAPIDEIQFDPFHSPWAPTSSGRTTGFAPARCRAAAEAAARQAPSAPVRGPTDDFRAAVADYERQLLEDALAAIASTSARPRRRWASATTSFATR